MNKLKEILLRTIDDEELYTYVQGRFYHKRESAIKRELEKDYSWQVDTARNKAYASMVLRNMDIGGADLGTKLIQSLRKALTRDLCSHIMTSFLYETFPRRKAELTSPPLEFVREDGGKVEVPFYKTDMDIKSVYLYGTAWSLSKLITASERSDDLDPEQMEDNTLPLYFPNVNFLMLTGGNAHRIIEAYLGRQKALARVKVVDDMLILKSLFCDGGYWTLLKDGAFIKDCEDFRMGLIFTLR